MHLLHYMYDRWSQLFETHYHATVPYYFNELCRLRAKVRFSPHKI